MSFIQVKVRDGPGDAEARESIMQVNGDIECTSEYLYPPPNT
jgi:hypothetical protein